MTKKGLEFWFEYGSTYTYLSVMRIEQLAEGKGLKIEWKPFLLMPIITEMGWQNTPFLQFPSKGRYMWRDLERRASLRGLPYRKPSVYPPNTLLTARIGLIATQEDWCPDFTRRTFHGHFVEDKVMGEVANITEVLTSMGKDQEQVITAAQRPENKEGLRQQTKNAANLGIFGSPSFVVGDELFWGDDRLEDALEWVTGH